MTKFLGYSINGKPFDSAGNSDLIPDVNQIIGITYTVGVNDWKIRNTFTNNNPIAFTVPTNAIVAVPIGAKFTYSVEGSGSVTISGAGITFIQKSLVFTTGATFTLEKVAINTWTVNGAVDTVISPTIINGNVYINSNVSYGNDSTAQLGNPLKPFLTLEAAMLAAESDIRYRKFIFMDGGVFYLNGVMGNTTYTFESNFGSTLSLMNNINSAWVGGSTSLNIQMPLGTVDFRSNTAKNNTTTSATAVINCMNYKSNANCRLRFTKMLVDINYMTHEGGTAFYCTTAGSRFVVSTIANTINGGIFGFINNSYVSFDTCTSSTTFILFENGANNNVVDFGNYTATSTGVHTFINSWSSSSIIKINFKNSTIAASINFGGSGSFVFTGNATFTGSTTLFSSRRLAESVKLINCYLKCISFSQQYSDNDTSNYNSFLLIDSFVECDYFYRGKSANTTEELAVAFKGFNTVILSNVNQFVNCSSSAQPISINNYGILKTNGIIGANVTKYDFLT